MKKEITRHKLHSVNRPHPSFHKDFINFLSANKVKLLTLVVLVILTYLIALKNGFVSDDINGVMKNRAIQNFSSVTLRPLSFVQPLYVFISYKLFGVNAAMFHLTGVVLHLFITLTVFGVFVFFGPPLAAFFGAALFAVHPLMSEPVVWISANSYLLYSFFFVLSFLSYLIFRKYNKSHWYIVSLISFVLSLCSSDKSYFLFLIFPLYEATHGNLRNTLKAIVPYMILGMIFFVYGILHIGPRLNALQPELIGAVPWDNPLVQIPFALSSYLKLFLFPARLTLFHTEYFTDTALTALYFIMTGLFLGIIYITFRKNKTLFFWLLFFVIALLPTLSPFHISNLVAERYAYLPAVGLFFTAGFVFRYLVGNKKITFYAWIIFVVILVSLSLRTVIRVRDWQNERTLGLNDRNNPKSSATKFENLGNAYLQEGNLPLAVAEFQKAIELRPDYADLYNNLGFAFAHMNRFNDASVAYQKALKLNPKLWQAYDNIAAIYAAQKKYDNATSNLKKATLLAPDNNELIIHLGIVYLMSGDKKQAKEQFSKALLFDPKNEEAKNGLKEASK